MINAKIKFVDLPRLKSQNDQAVTIIRLMMACNDISVANHCLGLFKDSYLNNTTLGKKPFEKGAAMYFVRIQCGHLSEAIKVIDEIKSDRLLCEELEDCSEAAKACFNQLTECLKGGSAESDFNDYITRIRNNVAFHYDKSNNDKMIKWALTDRAERAEARTSTITLGGPYNLSRFDLADDLIDSIICRQIAGIPRTSDLREEIDKIMDFGSELCHAILMFGSEFIIRFLNKHSLI